MAAQDRVYKHSVEHSSLEAVVAARRELRFAQTAQRISMEELSVSMVQLTVVQADDYVATDDFEEGINLYTTTTAYLSNGHIFSVIVC